MFSAGGESIIVRASILVGIAALGLAAFFVVFTLLLRRLVNRRREHRLAVEERWLPVMFEALREPVREGPRLRRRDQTIVLAEWNRLVTPLSGEGVRRLRAFARNAGLSDAAHRLIQKGRPDERLVATVFLGHQQDLRAVRTLRELVERPEPIVRSEAARALVRLDPVNGARAVAPVVVNWDDCHPATAVSVLADAPDDVVADVLGELVFETDDVDRQARILEILGTVQSQRAAEVARRMIPRTIGPELIARCLEILSENPRPDDAVLVRPLLRHDVAFVRLRAVATLVRLQAPGDEWRIVGLLDDPDWWVRHRAAEATLQSRRFDRRFIELIARIHPDRYARGALNHVLTERGS